ncbi:S8 family peptidase [Streptomyces sp. NPDC053048]|uniref:S8 family peptidase n=1 Tax=Streptomyces sp. NPDC053048 TaxID=3365694 RepID=UPI0037D43455
MMRHYYRRDRLVEVEQLDDVVAVQVGADNQRQAVAEEAALETADRAALREADIDDETADAFERANWMFVRPSERALEALDGREEIAGAESVGKVIRRPDGRVGIATDLLNVQLVPSLSQAEAEGELEAADLTVVNKLNFADNLYEVRTRSAGDALEASTHLHENPKFVFAEPSFVEHVPQRLRPSDPKYSEQWQWRNTGANGGVPDADVHIEPAWDKTLGNGVRVAVIDNGFDADHEDLAAGVGPMSGFYSTGVVGTTFTQNTVGMERDRHGTLCAGMAGARKDNDRGGVGAAPECELMLVACLPDQVGTQTTLARAVAYAGNPATEVPDADPSDGADILVSSLGPNIAAWDLTTTLEIALEGAAAHGRQGKGLAIFWAASNGTNVDIMADEVVSHPDVIAVVRSDRKDLEDNAARGPEVELIAPGVKVFSTTPGDAYGTATGTSFAAPCAAGCAALALSKSPGLTRDQLREVMHQSADKVGGVVYDANGHNDDYGFGRVNASRAVTLGAMVAGGITPP